MGDVIDRHPPQWERRSRPEETAGDAVLALVVKLTAELNATAGVNPTIVRLAALRLALKAVILDHQRCVGIEETRETLKQASELAAQYVINGVGDDEA